MPKKIAVLGAGSWGTALAVLLGSKGLAVSLWARRAEHARTLEEQRENARYLPGVVLPPPVTVSCDLEAVLGGASAAVFCVPSHAFREVLKYALPFLSPGALVINTAKGLEEESLARLSSVFAGEAGEESLARYAVLSGPSHAEEVARFLPTAVVVSSLSSAAAQEAQDLFMCPYFRVYTNPDVTGVELGGALKNVIALGTGIAEGLGYGDNTKAALITRGLAEITRLGVALGAHPLTFAGLSGLGDLIVTCTSRHSRNRRAGICIGKGKTLDEALEEVKMVVEGVRTARAVRELAASLGVEMPISFQMHGVLFGGVSPTEAVNNLMTRSKRNEVEEVALAAAALGQIRIRR